MFSDQRGQALIIVMLLMTAVFILGGATLSITSSARKNATEEIYQKKAYYIAEAGVERALSKLRVTPEWRSTEGKELIAAYGGGQIESVVVKDADIQKEIAKLVEIKSTGVFCSAWRIVGVKVLVFSSVDLLNGISILPDEETEVEFSRNLMIQSTSNSSEAGKVIINGDLELDNIEIDTDLYLSGTLKKRGECRLTGICHPNYPFIPSFPQLDQAELSQKAENKGQLYPGSKKFGGKKEKLTFAEQDIYYVDGDVEISGTYSGGPAIIAATGDIKIDDSLKMDSDAENLLVLVCFGNKNGDEKAIRVIQKNIEVDALIVSYSGFNIDGDATLRGCVVTKHLVNPENKLNGNLIIECDLELVRSSLPSYLQERFIPEARILSWQEI